MWIDFLLSAERMYYKATTWPVLLGTLFTIWSLIHYHSGLTNEHGNRYIYSSYDWSSSTAKPIGFYFASVVILTFFSCLSTFIKNLIIMRSGLGEKMSKLKKEQKTAESGDTEMADRTNDATNDAEVEL